MTKAVRLFNKNTALRQPEMVYMEGDACSVVESETPSGSEGPLNSGGNYDPLKVA